MILVIACISIYNIVIYPKSKSIINEKSGSRGTISWSISGRGKLWPVKKAEVVGDEEGAGIERWRPVVVVTGKTRREASRRHEEARVTTLHPRADRERTGGRPLRQCGAHTAIRMGPFNMAGVAGLLATCAAVAASAAHLLPLLLLLICPRGTQADQGKRSSVQFPFFYLTFCCLRTYVGLIKPK